MTATQSVQLYQILQEHFGKNENATKAVSAIEAIVDEKVEGGNKRYGEILHKDIEILGSSIDGKLEILRSNIDGKLEILRSNIDGKLETLRTEIRDQKVDLVKWFVGLFIALVLLIIGLYVRK